MFGSKLVQGHEILLGFGHGAGSAWVWAWCWFCISPKQPLARAINLDSHRPNEPGMILPAILMDEVELSMTKICIGNCDICRHVVCSWFHLPMADCNLHDQGMAVSTPVSFTKR